MSGGKGSGGFDAETTESATVLWGQKPTVAEFRCKNVPPRAGWIRRGKFHSENRLSALG